MSGIYGNKTLAEFREEQERLSRASKERKRKLEEEAKAREKALALANRKPEVQMRKEAVENMRNKLKETLSGDPTRERAVIREALEVCLSTMQYLLKDAPYQA